MHWLLRLKSALKATIHGVAFETVAKNARVVLAIKDIEDQVFWKVVFCLLRAVFPVKYGNTVIQMFQLCIKYFSLEKGRYCH